MEDEIGKLRVKIRDLLREFVGPGLISPEVAAPFLEVSYRTVYRWLALDAMAPRLEEAQKISKFLTSVVKIRDSWSEVIVSWRSLDHVHPAIREVLYDRRFLNVLEGNLDPESKVDKLLKMTLKKGALKLEEK